MRRTQEWLAARTRFVQYPRERRYISQSTAVDKAFTLTAFVWAMILIWGSVGFWVAVVALAILLVG